MKIRLRTPILEAEQWFPGKKLKGVVGDYPPGATKIKLCGCVMIGGPSNRPHIHMNARGGYILQSGLWILYLDGEPFDVQTDEEIKEKYEHLH